MSIQGVCEEGGWWSQEEGVSAQQKGETKRGIPAARVAGKKVKHEGEGWNQRLALPALRSQQGFRA